MRQSQFVKKLMNEHPDQAHLINAAYEEGREDGKNDAIDAMGNMMALLEPITGDEETDSLIRQQQIRERTSGNPDIDAAIAALYPDGKRA